MTTIFKHAIHSYDVGGSDGLWCYLNTLIIRGDIDEGEASRIADAVEWGA